MNRSYSKIRHIQEANQQLEKRLLSEQSFGVPSGNPDEAKIIQYVIKKWGLKPYEGIEQNSAYTSVTSKDGSELKFNFQKNVIELDKSGGIDPKPIPMNTNFNEFKKWFDSNNNGNPVSSVMK